MARGRLRDPVALADVRLDRLVRFVQAHEEYGRARQAREVADHRFRDAGNAFRTAWDDLTNKEQAAIAEAMDDAEPVRP